MKVASYSDIKKLRLTEVIACFIGVFLGLVAAALLIAALG
jgi:uncharacterized protein YacL